MYPSLLMSSEIWFAHIMKTAHCPSIPCHYSCQRVPFWMDLGLWSPLVAWPVSLWKLSSWNHCSQGLMNLPLASLHSCAHISLSFSHLPMLTQATSSSLEFFCPLATVNPRDLTALSLPCFFKDQSQLREVFSNNEQHPGNASWCRTLVRELPYLRRCFLWLGPRMHTKE